MTSVCCFELENHVGDPKDETRGLNRGCTCDGENNLCLWLLRNDCEEWAVEDAKVGGG